MTVIQNIILPELSLGAPLNMYFRVNKADFDARDILEAQAEYNYSDKILILRSGDKYYFNTYYNGFSVNIWQQNCAFSKLSLWLRGKGRVRAELALMQHESDLARSRHDVLTHKILAQYNVELTPEGVSLPIENWPQLKRGILYLSLQADDDRAEFYGGAFTTAEPPRPVRLGIVITHYNRKQYVLPALKRLKRDILDNPLYREHISIAVADNSRNITETEAQGATVLPNPNYGGAGGFARGLLHWQDKGFSHCLFMDDDASCETESIYRTLSLLQYARYDNLAVSGAMLREAEPYLLWAKGEYWHKFSIDCPKRGLDMRFAAHLLFAEEPNQNNTQQQYGGFWHFAFPIAKTAHYPFPFFVRGDDMLFGLSNDFRIITLNGISAFAEDFSVKHTPFISYLSLRADLLIAAAADSASVPAVFIRCYRRYLRGQLYAYNYAHGRAVSLAAQDFMQSISFWRHNMDLSAVRQKLAQQADGEKLQVQKLPARGQMRPPMRESKCRKLFRKLTQQGSLLPSAFINDETALIPKNFSGNPALSFRRRRVFYYTDDLSHGYYAEYDKSRFWQEWRLGRQIRRDMKRNLPAILADYRQNWQSLACESFWRNVYAAELAAQDANSEPHFPECNRNNYPAAL